METVLYLLIWQGAVGAFDALWNHEWKENLPNKSTAVMEQYIHGAREFLLACLFIGLAWFEWRGMLAWMIAALLAAEILLTGWDYIVEDKTRILSPNEAVLHLMLSMGGGACVALLVPELLRWSALPDGLILTGYGLASWILSLSGIGAFIWSLRDFRSAIKLSGLRGSHHGAALPV
jgi:hypothetical protein